jgi:hypothetical protein
MTSALWVGAANQLNFPNFAPRQAWGVDSIASNPW